MARPTVDGSQVKRRESGDGDVAAQGCDQSGGGGGWPCCLQLKVRGQRSETAEVRINEESCILSRWLLRTEGLKEITGDETAPSLKAVSCFSRHVRTAWMVQL